MKTNALYYGDNLIWLQNKEYFPDKSIDLIYLDPPFNSNADYNLIFNERFPRTSSSSNRYGNFAHFKLLCFGYSYRNQH